MDSGSRQSIGLAHSTLRIAMGFVVSGRWPIRPRSGLSC